MACSYIQVLNENRIRNSVFSVVQGLTSGIVYSGKVLATEQHSQPEGHVCLSVSLSLMYYIVTDLDESLQTMSWKFIYQQYNDKIEHSKCVVHYEDC